MKKDLILEKNDDIGETFNDFFTIIVSKLNIPRYQDPWIESDPTQNRIGHTILRIIEQCKNHPSVIAINYQNMDSKLSFQEITKSEINHATLNLDISKACQESEFPTKIIKPNSDLFTEVANNPINIRLGEEVLKTS